MDRLSMGRAGSLWAGYQCAWPGPWAGPERARGAAPLTHGRGAGSAPAARQPPASRRRCVWRRGRATGRNARPAARGAAIARNVCRGQLGPLLSRDTAGICPRAQACVHIAPGCTDTAHLCAL
ncbi:unnamed protein product, partial [Lepidochelys kempii]